MVVTNGDYFAIVIVASGGNTTYYQTYDFTNLDSDTYTKFRARYKTSGCNAEIVLNFTSGSQTVLSESLSATWKAAGSCNSRKLLLQVSKMADLSNA